ncbi:Tir chaperone protein (CesT) [Variovorax sp. PBL-H6]|uniref:type III secretion system chaperone n=1 Tax=Variovorax sp. PBL-H6 TaxID=434009 RepID=UPI0013165BFB|nr:type III secretion system chaperone [Variovorax sp. PBL-H6]VTU28248.1 Tir chaperone protein (CesT) [Variovorax sp. PBL-H6]
MTIDSDQIARLLVEVGQRTPRIESIVQEANSTRWAIELGDGSIVLAELDEERGRLILETDLGQPPQEHRLATCELLMMLTSLEHASKGWAMALTEPDGEFQLCGHVLVTQLSVVDLQSNFESFIGQAQEWREIVARGAQQEQVEEETLNPDFLV